MINRDSEMERGTLPPSEKEPRRENFDQVEGSSTSQDEKDERSSRSQDESTTRVDGSDIRDENAPDGGEIVQEWQEGPHRIVERRAGPGEEVRNRLSFHIFVEPDVCRICRLRSKYKKTYMGQKKPRSVVSVSPKMQHRTR